MSGRTAAGAARLVALFAGLALLAALSSPTPATVAAGLALVVPGEALRVWAAGHLVKTERLVTSGPYRFTRNPMYLGRLALLTGLVVMAWLPHGASLVVLAASWAGFFGYYLPRKERVEPERMRRRHGRLYERYRRAVPALFPRLTPWQEGGRDPWSAERLVASRELLTAAALAAFAALCALKSLAG